jgi:hypothetical protein
MGVPRVEAGRPVKKLCNNFSTMDDGGLPQGDSKGDVSCWYFFELKFFLFLSYYHCTGVTLYL